MSSNYVVDAAGRWHWIDRECKNIEVGDRFVLKESGRWGRDNSYSKPLTVTRFTEFTFWVEDEDGKEIRISRSNAQVHGSRWSHRYAKKYTPELKKEIKKAKRAKKAKANAAKEKANAEEKAKREKYGADFIKDDAIQAVLKPIRDKAAAYDKSLTEIFEEFEGATAEEPHKLSSWLEWNSDNPGKISKFERVRDAFTRLHEELVHMVLRWEDGIAHELKRPGSPDYVFDPSNNEGTAGLVRLLESKVGVTLDEQTSTYFNGHNQDDNWRYLFIYDLREIKDMRWDYSRIDILEDE